MDQHELGKAGSVGESDVPFMLRIHLWCHVSVN